MLINKNHVRRIWRIFKRIVTKILFLILFIFIIYDFILSIYFEKLSLANDSEYTNKYFCDNVQVHFVDVGQGDGTVILYQDKVIVIDAGPMIHKFTMKNYLQELGVKRINALIITHPHQDHFGGIDSILCNFKVDQIYTTEITSKVDKSIFEKYHLYLYNYITSKYNLFNNYDKLSVVKNDNIKSISFDDLKLKFICPHEVYENFNNNSLVIRLDYKNTSMLFTGDIQSEAEHDLVKYHSNDLKVDVLKIAHHGSHTSTTQEFLNAVNPSIGVISCGYDNDLWHPHQSVATRLKNSRITLYRTDESGTIVLQSDGNVISSNKEKGDYLSGSELSSK